MKKYLAFAFDTYYPAGGLEDIRKSFDTIDEAKEYLEDDDKNWFTPRYIIDKDTMEKVVDYD